MSSINDQFSARHNIVDGVGQSCLSVSSPGGVLLIVTLGIVTWPLLGCVHVTECFTLSCSDSLGSLYLIVCLSHSNKELIVLESPAPVLVAHTINMFVHLARDQENTTDEGWVIILGMETRR